MSHSDHCCTTRERKIYNNYRTVEESYRQGQYYRFDIVDGKLNIQFNEGEPYFEGIDIAKPKVKMTAFKFDNHKIVTELTLNESMIGEGHYDVRLRITSRNKKHTMYVPLVSMRINNIVLTLC